jgi:hypothetical protein
VFGFIKKTTNCGIEKMYLLYIFPPELHTLINTKIAKVKNPPAP